MRMKFIDYSTAIQLCYHEEKCIKHRGFGELWSRAQVLAVFLRLSECLRLCALLSCMRDGFPFQWHPSHLQQSELFEDLLLHVAHSNNWSFAQIFQLHNFGLESSMMSRWWCPDMISQRSCWDIMFVDNFCQIKVWMHSKIDQTSLFCAFIPLPRKKTWKREKIQLFANDIMLGHLPFKWLLETGEAKTCKLDQYAYRSCWDISLREFSQKLMKVKPEKSQIWNVPTW